MSYSDKQTEIELNKLTARIQEVYKVAWAEARQEASAYFRQFEARYKKEFKAFEQGAYTKDQFTQWYWAQVGRGEKWEKVRDNMRDTFTQANVTAASMTKSAMPGVYALNANYEAYQIYKETGIDFALYDEATVAGIMQGKTKILPSSRVSVPKSDAWNTKQLENSLLSGILQGKSIDKIADVFQNVASMDRSAAIRNARTAMTAAQNAGRQDTYERAHDMGIEMQKEWMATIDERTRESHAELDGIRVEYDEEFPNGLMFPGDASGEPSEIYNCRCTIRAILQKYNGQERPSEIEGHEGIHTKETYKEWADRKREEQMLNSKPTSYTDATARAVDAKETTQDIFTSDEEKAQAWYKSMTARQREVIEYYVSGEGMEMNEYLRGRNYYREHKPDESLLRDVRDLTEAIDSYGGLAENQTLYRSVDVSAVLGSISEEVLSNYKYGFASDKEIEAIEGVIGKTITDKGFMSTTTDKEAAWFWGDFTGAAEPCVIELEAHKGDRAANLKAFDVEDDPQNEVLFAPNTHFVITGVSYEKWEGEGNLVFKARIK